MAATRVVIHNQIRALRFARNEMTQQQLAEKIGVSRQTVNAIETEKYEPSLTLAFKIARLFDDMIESIFQPTDANGIAKP